MSTTTENIEDSPGINNTEGDPTFVEGVGNIPRDIYKYVKSDPLGDLHRYSYHIVIQHFLTFATFLILAATGLTLHFASLWWAPLVMKLFGGPDTARIIHRYSAAIMVLASDYHICTIFGGTFYKIFKKQFELSRTQIPHIKDIKDIVHDIKYFLGKEKYRPKMNKFMYKQKLHYIAIIWGTFVLISAGTTLLYPEIMSTIWPNPRFAQDLARLMHADEAIMAVTVIVFWHWSNVHLVPGRFPLQWSFLTGNITREHQIEEHFLEYIKNLEEYPEEKEYIKKVMKENGFDTN